MTETQNENQLAVVEPPQVTEAVLHEYLTGMGSSLKPAQKQQFLQIARSYGLNPFKREIYAISYGNNFNIIVGYEVYLKRAEMSGQLAGWKVWTEQDGDDVKGCIEIRRKDWNQPFYHEVCLSEYDQRNQMWKSKPKTMIKKVAMAQGFRLAFPVELGGIPYTSDEIPNAEPQQSNLQGIISSIQSAPDVETLNRVATQAREGLHTDADKNAARTAYKQRKAEIEGGN
jgi:phage recombination protein Bet